MGGVGRRLFVDNICSALFGDMTAGKINCFAAVYPNRNGMLGGFGCRTLKMEWGDIQVRIRGDLTEVLQCYRRTGEKYTC